LTRHTAPVAEPLLASAHTTVLIALAPLRLAAHAVQWQLGALDAALIGQSTPCQLSTAGGEAAAYYLAEIAFSA
jgi:hypothetical protein